MIILLAFSLFFHFCWITSQWLDLLYAIAEIPFQLKFLVGLIFINTILRCFNGMSDFFNVCKCIRFPVLLLDRTVLLGIGRLFQPDQLWFVDNLINYHAFSKRGGYSPYLRNINKLDSQKNVLHIIDIYVNVLYTVVNVSCNLITFLKGVCIWFSFRKYYIFICIFYMLKFISMCSYFYIAKKITWTQSKRKMQKTYFGKHYTAYFS